MKGRLCQMAAVGGAPDHHVAGGTRDQPPLLTHHPVAGVTHPFVARPVQGGLVYDYILDNNKLWYLLNPKIRQIFEYQY